MSFLILNRPRIVRACPIITSNWLRLASPVCHHQPPPPPLTYPAITSSVSSPSTYTHHCRQLSSFPPHPSAPTTCSYSQTQPAPKPPSMAPVPATMKAVQVSKTGGVEVLEYKDVPVPTPKEGQVLVKNEFAGVNFIDTYFRSGLYKLNLPVILGSEAAGEVVSHHKDVTDLPVGTKVVYMGSQAYAQYTAVPASGVIAIPAGLTTEQAAASFLQGLTAWTFIREAGNVQPGQWALVHAAAGGVGQLLVQMLKSLGAKVIGTASTQEKCDLAKKLGAEWTVSSKDDVVARVNEITGGHGVDAIFDGVGAATFDADLQMIALKGRLVSFGNASGPVPDFSILRLSDKNVTLLRPKVHGYVSERRDLEKYSAELFEKITSGQVKIAIHDIYPLKEVGRAHSDLESRKTKGKLLLSVE
ncbi:hypothetical protein J3458_019089 [Metarhizium acridum]|uniref:uncharacterized protein n=1 Tax=Metarhizium acridum TaxID=92637 RepID=UPI001C6D13BB|nr:hypothetical protein J3458_019089 [Metarhizium acridum]